MPPLGAHASSDGEREVGGRGRSGSVLKQKPPDPVTGRTGSEEGEYSVPLGWARVSSLGSLDIWLRH